MDCKLVIAEQIRELQKVQDNVSKDDAITKIAVAKAIADLCETVYQYYLKKYKFLHKFYKLDQ